MKAIKNILSLIAFSLFISCVQENELSNDNEMVKDAIAEVNSKLEKNNELSFYSYIDAQKQIDIAFKLPNKHTLVFKSSYQNCDMCFDAVMATIAREHWQQKLDFEVWIDDLNMDQRIKRKSWYKSADNIQFRKVQNNLFNKIESNSLNKPFFFVYNSENKSLSHVFFPELDNDKNTKKYLSIILERYPKH